MTPRQVSLVQESWQRVLPISEAAAELLYARLFALDPSLKALYYSVVESALIWTLQQGLGAAFTRETEDAWRIAYGVLAATMKEAAAMQANLQAVEG